MKRFAKTLSKNLNESGRVGLLAAPFAILLSILAVLFRPSISGDELTCVVAVPLLICYVMIRAVILLAKPYEATPEELEVAQALEREPGAAARTEPMPLMVVLLVVGFVLSVWIGTATVLCIPAYWGLDMGWTAEACRRIARGSFESSGLCAGILAVRLFYKPAVMRIATLARRILYGSFSELIGHRRHHGRA